MLFEFSKEQTEGYVVHNFSVENVPVSLVEGKLKEKGYLTDNAEVDRVNLILFEDSLRFDLGLYVDDCEDIYWLCRGFTIPASISSDKDFISGMFLHWLFD